MMRLKVFNTALFLLFVWAQASAQINVNVSLLSSKDDTPIHNAELYNATLAENYSSNHDGKVIMKNLALGAYDIVIFVNEYQTIQTRINIDHDHHTFVFKLHPIQVNLDLIEISAEEEKKYALKRLRAVEGTAIYAGKKNEVILLENITANLASNNSRQIYSQISGLNIFEADDAGLQLNIGGRGLDPNRTASFNTRQNNYDISADVLGYPESYYSPPAEALQEVQIIRGAASLQYGTQFGGLVNFMFKNPSDNNIELISRQTLGSFDLFTSFNSLSGTLGKVKYYSFFNYKTGDGFRENSEFESKNYYGFLEYNLKKSKLSIEYTHLDYLAQQAGGLTDRQFYEDPLFTNRSRNWFQVNWNLWAAKFNHKFNSNTDFSCTVFGLDASRSAVGFRTNRVSQIDDLSAPRDLIENNFLNWGMESRLLHRYAVRKKPAVFLFGVKLYESDNEALQGPGSAESNADFSLTDQEYPEFPNQSQFDLPNQNLALFSENIFYLTENFTLTPGIRWEYIHTQSEGSYRNITFDLAGNAIRDTTIQENKSLKRNILLLGLGASFRPNNEIEFYGNFSENYRSVTFNDLRIVNPSDAVDPNIKDESGFTADLGVRGRNNRISYDLSTFGLFYDNRIGEVQRQRDGETGPLIRFRGNIGKAVIYGIESLLDYRIIAQRDSQTLSAFVNLAITNSQYFESEIPGVKGSEVEFIPLINLKAGIRYRWKNLNANIQYTYLSSQFTDATNAPQIRIDNTSGILGAIPAYGIADFSLSYRFKFLQLETGINNLLDEKYFTRRATGYPGPGIIPSAPRSYYLTLQIKI